jgi:hypothetical protein
MSQCYCDVPWKSFLSVDCEDDFAHEIINILASSTSIITLYDGPILDELASCLCEHINFTKVDWKKMYNHAGVYKGVPNLTNHIRNGFGGLNWESILEKACRHGIIYLNKRIKPKYSNDDQIFSALYWQKMLNIECEQGFEPDSDKILYYVQKGAIVETRYWQNWFDRSSNEGFNIKYDN